MGVILVIVKGNCEEDSMNRNIEQVHAELIAAKDRYNEAREQTRQARKKETEAKIIMQKWQADNVMLMFEEKPLCERLTRLTNGRPAKGDEVCDS